MADKEAERIKFETEMLKLTALITTATGGGSIVLIGNPTGFRLVLASAGLLATIGLTAVVWRQRQNIRALIEQSKEEK